MILAAPPSIIPHHFLHSVRPPPGRAGHRRRLRTRRRLVCTPARAAVVPRDDGASTEAAAGDGAWSSSSESLAVANKLAASAVTPEVVVSLPKDYTHTLFHTEFLEVLGMVDIESLRKRPRLTVGVTVKASVALPVLVVLAVLYLNDVAKGVVDWTHHLEAEDEGY